jgi:hypothetical protein
MIFITAGGLGAQAGLLSMVLYAELGNLAILGGWRTVTPEHVLAAVILDVTQPDGHTFALFTCILGM